MGWEKLSTAFEKSLEVASQSTELAQQTGGVSFSLIISLVAIALVMLLVFATIIYGGDAFKEKKNQKKKTKNKLDFSPR
jgi:uncharacterized protein (DUF2062 family)